MTNNPDYRKYLESKFDSFEEMLITKFETMDVKLDNIHEQVIKTNSRVNHLEEFRIHGEAAIIRGEEAIKNRVTTAILKEAIKDVETKIDDQHLAKCPQQSRIKSIEDILTRRTAINMWVLRVIALMGTLVGVVYGIVKIIESINAK